MKRLFFITLLTLVTFLHAVYLREGWESGRIWTNQWILEPACENWQIQNMDGYQLRFSGFPQLIDYSSTLLSREFDISVATSLSLQFSCLGLLTGQSQTEQLAVEYQADNGAWTQLDMLDAIPADPQTPMQEYNYLLSGAVGHNTLRLRFRVLGSDSSVLLRWTIDDILLHDQNYLPPAIISGFIHDAAGEPVSGAWINDGIDHARSDTNGLYQISVNPASECNLRVQAFGFEDTLRTAGNVASGLNYTQNFVLEPEAGHQDPFNLGANVYYAMEGPALSVSWSRVNENPGDGVFELAYDNLPLQYFYRPFMINQCEYLLVRFDNPLEMNLGAVKLALQAPAVTELELVAFYEQDGCPDPNNPLFEQQQLFTYCPTVPSYPEWVQFPIFQYIPPQTPFYLGVKYLPGQLFSLGIASTVDHPSWYSMDDSNEWDTTPGEAAMIRLLGQEYEPWMSRTFSGYNLYCNHQKLNAQPLADTYVNISEPDWGNHLFYVTAVYGDHESNPSNSVLAEVNPLQISNVSYETPVEEAPYLNVLSEAYNIRGGLMNLELYKNDVLIHTFAEIDPDPYKYTAIFHDPDFQNDQSVNYHLVAHYQDGSTLSGEAYTYRLLLAPSNLQAAGVAEGVQLQWNPPHLPDRNLLGYQLERSDQMTFELITGVIGETSYTDTGVAAGEIYSYRVAAIYSDGQAWSMEVRVVAGAPVFHPVTGLTACFEPPTVKLNWQRPADGKYIIGKDSDGHSGAFTNPAPFTAGVKFAQGDLINALNKDFVCLAFIPESSDPYTVKIYNCTNDEEFLVNELVLNEPLPGEWNSISTYGIYFEQPMASYRFEISGSGGIRLDDAATPVLNANLINLDSNWTDLNTAFGITHNWKFKLKIKDPDAVIPVHRDLYPDLFQYQVMRNGIQIGWISDFEQCFRDSLFTEGTLQYQVTAVYDMGNAEPSSPVTIIPSSSSDLLNPAGIVLNQPCPNPFNPSTTLSFSISEAASTSLDIYNLKGQRVKVLCQANLPAGKHSYVWDGKDTAGKAVASGVYFLRLRSGGQSRTAKMILMK